MSCGVRVALVPFSPVTVIGADTAGLATFSSAAVTSSDVVVGADLDERQRDRRARRPVARQHGRGGGHVELLAGDGLDGLRGDAVEADVALDGGLVDRGLQLGERGVQRGGVRPT